MPRLVIAFIVLTSAVFSGCGYLDTDLDMSDDEWEASLAGGGISMSGGSYGFGCGGVGRFGHASYGGVGVARRASLGHGPMELDAMYIRGSARHDAATEPRHSARLEGSPKPVDWVGHFDDVTKERQNVLIAAWIEGQLADQDDGDEHLEQTKTGRPR